MGKSPIRTFAFNRKRTSTIYSNMNSILSNNVSVTLSITSVKKKMHILVQKQDCINVFWFQSAPMLLSGKTCLRK